jgi:Valyl-tRNA synthetase
MSKSLGTGIDPMMLIEKYGTDATRFGLAWQVTESQDMHFNEDNMVSGGKFCNKIWNAAKFILYQLGDGKRLYSASVKPPAVSKADRRILAGLKKIALSTEKRINKYEFGHAIRELYEFFWHEFCDIYIEAAKIQINRPKNKLAAEQTKSILIFTLANLLKLMHPFMPFITEEVYRFLPVKNKKDMIVESWPEMK